MVSTKISLAPIRMASASRSSTSLTSSADALLSSRRVRMSASSGTSTSPSSPARSMTISSISTSPVPVAPGSDHSSVAGASPLAPPLEKSSNHGSPDEPWLCRPAAGGALRGGLRVSEGLPAWGLGGNDSVELVSLPPVVEARGVYSPDVRDARPPAACPPRGPAAGNGPSLRAWLA